LKPDKPPIPCQVFFFLGANGQILRRNRKARYPFSLLLPSHNPRQSQHSNTTTIGAILEKTERPNNSQKQTTKPNKLLQKT